MPVASDDMFIYRGEGKTWTVTVTDNAGARVDLTSASAYFAVRTVLPAGNVSADTGAELLLAKTVGTGITILNPSASGQMTINVTKGDTSGVSAIGLNTPMTYFYGLEYLVTGTGDPVLLAQGRFYVYPDVVRAV